MSVLVALSRGDIADYVNALFTVYFVLIISRIVLSWVQAFRPLPYNRVLRAVTGFIQETVDPYLNIFRRLLPTLNLGGMGLDLSPIIGIIVLVLVQSVVVGLIGG